jgi:hypothetical protein
LQFAHRQLLGLGVPPLEQGLQVQEVHVVWFTEVARPLQTLLLTAAVLHTVHAPVASFCQFVLQLQSQLAAWVPFAHGVPKHEQVQVALFRVARVALHKLDLQAVQSFVVVFCTKLE